MVTPLPPNGGAGIIFGKHLTVKAAAKHFGYNEQYLRRLLRSGRLEGVKIGQIWLIELASLQMHLHKVQDFEKD